MEIHYPDDPSLSLLKKGRNPDFNVLLRHRPRRQRIASLIGRKAWLRYGFVSLGRACPLHVDLSVYLQSHFVQRQKTLDAVARLQENVAERDAVWKQLSKAGSPPPEIAYSICYFLFENKTLTAVGLGDETVPIGSLSLVRRHSFDSCDNEVVWPMSDEHLFYIGTLLVGNRFLEELSLRLEDATSTITRTTAKFFGECVKRNKSLKYLRIRDKLTLDLDALR